VQFPLSMTWGLAALALAWIVALPLLVDLGDRFERGSEALPAEPAAT
jgi:hypothetical protein